MIKSVTIKKDILVCDICGGNVRYEADSNYAKRSKHFCTEHRLIESLYEQLCDNDYKNVASMFFEEAKRKGKYESKTA